MEKNTLMLLMTDKGAQRMRTLIAQGSVISLFITIGNGRQKPSKATTALSGLQEIGAITLLSAINTEKNNWHVNAHFSPTDLEYDITEIGVFINDAKKSQADILWGIYFSETAIARKMHKADLLLDIIITLEGLTSNKELVIQGADLKPSFSIPHATSNEYGAVKFASEVDIKARIPGLALSTSHLDELISSVDKDGLEGLDKTKLKALEILDATKLKPLEVLDASKLKAIEALDKTKLKALEILDAIKLKPLEVLNATKLKELADLDIDKKIGESCKIIGNHLLETNALSPMKLFFRENKIYALWMEVDEGFGKALKRVTYSIENNTIAESRLALSEKFVYLPSVSNGYHPDYLGCLAFKHPDISQNTVWQLKIPTSDSAKTAIVHEQLVNFKTWETGSLLFCNEAVCIIGGLEKQSKQLLLGKDKDANENFAFLLAYSRKKPLVHVVQEKIYCLGGAKNREPILEVHTVYQKDNKINHSYFLPENTASFDLSDTDGYTSCVVGHYIYIFKPAAYHRENTNRYFYIYDCSSNIWQSAMLPENLFVEHDMKPQSGQAVSDGKAIYLFCTQELHTKTQLSILKFYA